MAKAVRSQPFANRVRIIGGVLRRRLLVFPDVPGLRPTPDRVRETLFNWLGQDLTGMNCLDAFAGSGALGFEAASRGARRVVMIDASRAACEALNRNRAMLDVAAAEIYQTDALAWMRAHEERFDLILLDPPFSSPLAEVALPLAAGRLKPDGWLYMEQPDRVRAPDGFIIYREGAAGTSHYALLKRG